MALSADRSAEYPWLKKYPHNIDWFAPLPSVDLSTFFEEAARKFPQSPCVDFLGKKHTYAEGYEIICRIAKGLQDLGVKKGTRVGICMPNSAYFVFFYYGILRAGGTVVNYSPLYAPRELAGQIQDSETEIMVTMDLQALYPKIDQMLSDTNLRKIIICPLAPSLPFPKNILAPIFKSKDLAKIAYDDRHVAYADVIKNDGNYAKVDINPQEDIAVVQYTGGTTGLPKGAMLTHANLSANVSQARMWFTLAEEGKERILGALPLFHVFAMTAVMNIAVRMGAEIVMMFPRFNVDDAITMIEKHKITFFPAVPTIYTMINNHPRGNGANLTSLKACLSGGAALPVEVKRKFEALTGCKLVEAYGLSETSPAATSNPLYGENKAGSIGIPFPGTVIKVMSLQDPDKEMPLGEKGEICISGPQVMKGYWRRPAETASCLIDGFLHTGDVGYMDEDGYIYLVDRIKDMIVCSGYNVYPRNVEEVIYMHPAVEETTVIGVPDEKRGETVKAFVKLRAGSSLTAEQLIEFLNDKLSPVEIPKFVEFREELPKTLIGKLSKKELVAEELAKIAREKENASKAKSQD
ncbi:MAG: long-chain-fatty-acid--CoA ligase [Holosporales bacterium]